MGCNKIKDVAYSMYLGVLSVIAVRAPGAKKTHKEASEWFRHERDRQEVVEASEDKEDVEM